MKCCNSSKSDPQFRLVLGKRAMLAIKLGFYSGKLSTWLRVLLIALRGSNPWAEFAWLGWQSSAILTREIIAFFNPLRDCFSFEFYFEWTEGGEEGRRNQRNEAFLLLLAMFLGISSGSQKCQISFSSAIPSVPEMSFFHSADMLPTVFRHMHSVLLS